MHQYKKLEFWQRSRQLAADLYQSTKNFPKEELFGLTNQMRPPSQSFQTFQRVHPDDRIKTLVGSWKLRWVLLSSWKLNL